MKKFSFVLMSVLAVAVSCNKSIDMPSAEGGDEIVLNVDGNNIDMNVETKADATALTAVPTSLYWGATTGTRGNSAEAQKWAAASASVSSSKINTGKYQTATATAYNYYVSNVNFTIPATGNVTMSATNTTDVVCGWAAAQTSATPSVALNHIFARTGTLTCNAQSGYSISNVSWKIVGKSTINGTAGTYNLSTGAWTAASTKLTTAKAMTSSSDFYLIPGTYTISVTYTLTLGDWSGTFTKSGDVTLVGGKKNNITCTAIGGTASQIVISVSLTAWGDQAVTLTLS